MNPRTLGHLCALLLPNPRSHWSATGPKSNTHRTTYENTQRKTTWAPAAKLNWSGWFHKSVRPVLLDLASTTRGNWLGRFCPGKTPTEPWNQNWEKQAQNPTKLEQGKPPLEKDLPAQKSSRKPTWSQTGQVSFWNRSGRFCLGSREEHSSWEKLNLHLNRSPDSLHGFKWDFGDSRGTS
jgi:hypothetical protein